MPEHSPCFLLRLHRLLALAVFALIPAACALAQTARVEVMWLGQSAFRITTPGGKVIVTDPWLSDNPATPARYRDLKELGRVDVLLVTHGHRDHILDAPALARMHEIALRAPGDLGQTLATLGLLPGSLLPRMNKGGSVEPVAGVRVTVVRAEHSSIFVWRNPATGKDETHPGGEPVGYLIELENGFRIWHMGDTDVFGDMSLIAQRFKPDLVLVPIGGNFTMDPRGAAYALRELIRPRLAIPMHFGTNPLAKGTPEQFVEAMGSTPTRVIVLKPGEKAEF